MALKKQNEKVTLTGYSTYPARTVYQNVVSGVLNSLAKTGGFSTSLDETANTSAKQNLDATKVKQDRLNELKESARRASIVNGALDSLGRTGTFPTTLDVNTPTSAKQHLDEIAATGDFQSEEAKLKALLDSAGDKGLPTEGTQVDTATGNTSDAPHSPVRSTYDNESSILQSEAASYLDTLKKQYENDKSDLDKAYEAFLNREAFAYNPSEDLLYQQNLATAQNMGRLAMEDTMGQASALTGGYGSSYAQRVGNSAYNQYLQDVLNTAPNYYKAAYDRYANETNDMTNRLKALNDIVSASGDNYESYIKYLNDAETAKEEAVNGDKLLTKIYTTDDSNNIIDQGVEAYIANGAEGVEAISGKYKLTDDDMKVIKQSIIAQYPLEGTTFTMDKNGWPSDTISYIDSKGNTVTTKLSSIDGKVSKATYNALKKLATGERYNALYNID